MHHEDKVTVQKVRDMVIDIRGLGLLYILPLGVIDVSGVLAFCINPAN